MVSESSDSVRIGSGLLPSNRGAIIAGIKETMATISGCSNMTDSSVSESSRDDKINFCIFLRCNTLSMPIPEGGGSCSTGRGWLG